MKTDNPKAGRVRIIGGVLKRTVVPVVDAPGLRPTSDRIRETLFNWIGADLTGARCLDLFAGTGALGFEAASRGAREVLLNESNRRVRQSLNDFRLRLAQSADAMTQQAVQGVQVLNADPIEIVRSRGLFDLIFLDPPFDSDWLPRLLPLMPDSMSPEAAIYLETSVPPQIPADLAVDRAGQAGRVHYYLLRQSQPNKDSA